MLSRAISASLSTSLSVALSATPVSLLCYHNIIAPLRQHYCPATTTSLPCYGNIIVLLRQHRCPATATSLSCYGNIMLLLFNALSWLFSGLVVKLIEPIKVKKWVSIVRLCEFFERLEYGLCENWAVLSADYVKNKGVYAVDYVKSAIFAHIINESEYG